MAQEKPRCKSLVLDAGPLLSLSPLRGLAEVYLTVPQVLEELKDKRAREHFERLGLSAGVRVEIRNPHPASLAEVIRFAKKTGDYSVLSHVDLCIIALTHSLETREKESLETKYVESEEKAIKEKEKEELEEQEDIKEKEDTGVELEQKDESEQNEEQQEQLEEEEEEEEKEKEKSEELDPPLYDDPSDDDDGEGEWITPGNVSLHKSRALALLPSDGDKQGKEEMVLAGCMTADFAMQNVLLQMGLNLVGTEGRRIQKVKSWVLRCHACFKICKDNTKQFCPSCGNPTLLRASVTIAAPNAAADAPVMQIHLKKNFQYKLRGTKYSIPAPKPGSSKTGPGEGLILREDQLPYMRAKKRADGKREREEQKMMKGLISKGGERGVGVGDWSDPDWRPEILSGTKERSARAANDLPAIGYGKQNPNAMRKR